MCYITKLYEYEINVIPPILYIGKLKFKETKKPGPASYSKAKRHIEF